MDTSFSSKLQKTLGEIGTKNGLAAPKSQDPINSLLHEYYVAESGRSVFEKRKKAALDELKSHVDLKRLTKLLTDANNGIVGTTQMFDSEDYSAQVTLKTPGTRVDSTVLRNELVKLGVDLAKINTAFERATTKNKPAETWAAIVKTT